MTLILIIITKTRQTRRYITALRDDHDDCVGRGEAHPQGSH